MPRLFFAVETPDALKKELVKLQDTIAVNFQKMIPIPNVKPEHLSNSHCTIRFLVNVEESSVEPIIGSARKSIIQARIPSFECKLASCGVFPNRRHARVMWVGLSPEAPFENIQHAVDDSLTAIGIPFEGARAFHPHLTLFRFREPFRLPLEFDFPDLTTRSTTVSISEVVLVESKTFAEGPQHTIRAKFKV